MIHFEKNVAIQSDPNGDLGLVANDELQIILRSGKLILQRRRPSGGGIPPSPAGPWEDWGTDCAVAITGTRSIGGVDHNFTITSVIGGTVKFNGQVETKLAATTTGGGTWMADEGP